MTVVELKNRLTTHGETIPKGVRKADLVALVMKIEIQLHKGFLMTIENTMK